MQVNVGKEIAALEEMPVARPPIYGAALFGQMAKTCDAESSR
jgi:hypothetical protein